MPASDDVGVGETDRVSVAGAKVTEVGASGSVYAPRDWAGERAIVAAAPEWWEVTENPEGVWVEWEQAEVSVETVPAAADASTNPQLYVGRGREGEVVLLALLED